MACTKMKNRKTHYFFDIFKKKARQTIRALIYYPRASAPCKVQMIVPMAG